MKTSYRKQLLRWLFGKPLEIQLVEACESLPGLRELGHNDEEGFDYVRIRELADSLRQELLPRGIVMIPNDLECDDEIFVAEDEKRTTEARVKTEFTITDGRRSIKLCSYGAARNANEGYAVAIAQTMALKAVLKRVSLQYGDRDDAEFVRLTPKPQKPKETPHQRGRQLAYQKRAWKDALATSGLTAEQADALLAKEFGAGLNCEVISALSADDFDAAMKWIIQQSDMTEQLQRSVDAAKKPKGPQAVVGILDKKVPRSEEMTGD